MATKDPDQSLRDRVASIAELREMTKAERKARTCRTCEITYKSADDAQQCARHHLSG